MQVIRGAAISDYVDQLGRFRIDIFKEYPYLYDGCMDYEREYLSRYSSNPEGFLIVIQDHEGLVGACTGLPLSGEDQDFQAAFNGETVNEIFYIGEVLIRLGSRGKQLGSSLLSAALGLVDSSVYKKVCLCTVDRGIDDPRRPANYFPPDSLWTKHGFEKSNSLLAFLDWKDLGEEGMTRKPMNLWLRSHVDSFP